jgi:hypothetical protein
MDVVTVTVSGPYDVVGGGRGGLHVRGTARTYRATYLGKDYVHRSKSEQASLLRFAARRAGRKVRIEYVADSPSARS